MDSYQPDKARQEPVAPGPDGTGKDKVSLSALVGHRVHIKKRYLTGLTSLGAFVILSMIF